MVLGTYESVLVIQMICSLSQHPTIYWKCSYHYLGMKNALYNCYYMFYCLENRVNVQ